MLRRVVLICPVTGREVDEIGWLADDYARRVVAMFNEAACGCPAVSLLCVIAESAEKISSAAT